MFRFYILILVDIIIWVKLIKIVVLIRIRIWDLDRIIFKIFKDKIIYKIRIIINNSKIFNKIKMVFN